MNPNQQYQEMAADFRRLVAVAVTRGWATHGRKLTESQVCSMIARKSDHRKRAERGTPVRKWDRNSKRAIAMRARRAKAQGQMTKDQGK